MIMYPVLIGSSALAYYYKDLGIEPRDIDLICSERDCWSIMS